MYMLVMVLDDAQQLSPVLKAWQSTGITGITILESTGVNRVLTRENPDASFMGFSHLLGNQNVGHNMIFAVIESMEMAEKVKDATEDVVGSLLEPDAGILFVYPVTKVWGIATASLGEGS